MSKYPFLELFPGARHTAPCTSQLYLYSHSTPLRQALLFSCYRWGD